ncbi:hypothetical protein [Sporosarcina sp. Te-1]|uniref:hypothetical protein n=1 Tax=Sporosarcina sp. Te-1 TaxID=2818390 RepID=UPI001FB0D67D|nr:hypothetical protein [Sporosarcina sp. Te-1]
MQFKITEEDMTVENEEFITRMIVKVKGMMAVNRGSDVLYPFMFMLKKPATNVEGNIYWDTKYPKAHLFFTGGVSLVKFVEDQGLEYAAFKIYWSSVKRLATHVFTEQEIKYYRKMMNI